MLLFEQGEIHFCNSFQAGGRIQEEQKYTRQQVKGEDFGDHTVYYENLIQTVKNENDNILTKESLVEHFQMLQEITSMEVRMFKR